MACGWPSRTPRTRISFIQTAEGYLQESQDILQRMRELAVQASNGIYSSEDRMQIQVEVSQLVDEINRIASHAQFNGMNMLTGRFARAMGENVITGSMWFHIGANMDQRERVYIGTMTAQGLGVQSTNGLTSTATFISISTPDKANMAIGVVDKALQIVSKQRADLGAYQNRLEYTMKGLVGRCGEPAGFREPHPRRGHGAGDGQLRARPDPGAVRHGHAGPGEHQAAVHPAALPVAETDRTRPDAPPPRGVGFNPTPLAEALLDGRSPAGETQQAP